MLPYRLSSHLAILLGLLLVKSCEGQSWEAFQNKHIDLPKASAPNNDAYCDLMMVRRKLNPERCKPRNTFINEDPKVIAGVCQGQGTPYGNFIDSSQPFSMVDCKNTGGSAPNECKYSGTSEDLHIRVKCENGYPVHLEAVVSFSPPLSKFASSFCFIASLFCIYTSGFF